VIPILLASASPRRQALLGQIGVRFEVRSTDIDETPHQGEGAGALVARLSAEKAAAAGAGGDTLVVAADTVVVLDGRILGKPRDADDNLAMLRRLAGREHRVLTGHTLLRGGERRCFVEDTRVVMRSAERAELERYVASGEGADKAGGYAIQGRGSALVRRIDGCYFNVVGLSVAGVVEAARGLGVALV